MVLSRKGLLTVDELRRSVEGLPAAAYATLPYYTKWARALTALMLERGVLSRADIDAALGPVETEDPPVLCAAALQSSLCRRTPLCTCTVGYWLICQRPARHRVRRRRQAPGVATCCVGRPGV